MKTTILFLSSLGLFIIIAFVVWLIGSISNIETSKIITFIGEVSLVGWCWFLSNILIEKIKIKENEKDRRNI